MYANIKKFAKKYLNFGIEGVAGSVGTSSFFSKNITN